MLNYYVKYKNGGTFMQSHKTLDARWLEFYIGRYKNQHEVERVLVLVEVA